MTIKLATLKSGEDVVSEIKEMVVGEDEERKVIGYFFTKPCVVRLINTMKVNEQDKENKSFEINLVSWAPLSKDETIAIPSDWVVTIVEPIDKVREMYENEVLKNGN